MKFNKKLKKGFTLVELIVVIAIVAILAAVSVVSYLAFINSANESADIQLVKQLNIALASDEALNDTRDTMYEMLEAMEKNGFVVENLTKTKSGYDIVWDQKHNRFALLDGSNVVFAEDSFKNTENFNLWKFVDTLAEVTSATASKYSIYLTEAFDNSNVETLNISSGLDVGKNVKIKVVNYTNSQQQNVTIRSNGGVLTIDGPNDSVKHFGFSTVVNCNDVLKGTYHENGTVGRLIYDDDDGKIHFGDSSVVYCYMNTSSDPEANLSDKIKDPNATVYTSVDDDQTTRVYKDKTVVVSNGLVDVSQCHNHNEDYDIITIGKEKYVVCKCCGGYSKYFVDEEGHLAHEDGEGIDSGNRFGVDNEELKLDVEEEPSYAVYIEMLDNDKEEWSNVYFETLDEAFAASKASEDADEGSLEIHLCSDLTVNSVFDWDNNESSYVTDIFLDDFTLSGNLFLIGTTITLHSGTVTANIYLNDVTENEVTNNCALYLGYDEHDWENDVANYKDPVTVTGQITLNGDESSLHILGDSVANNINNNGGHVIPEN